MGNLLGHASPSNEAAARIADACEGNPLFAEELLAMLIDDGLLRREDERWVLADELAELPVPPTIHALLAARLERLPEEERALLARVSVEGTVFHREVMRALAPEALVPLVDRSLTALVRKDVIRPDRAELRRRGRLPLPPHVDPRCGLSLAAEGDAGGVCTSVSRAGSREWAAPA